MHWGGLELIQAAGGLKSGLRCKPEQHGVYSLDDALRAVSSLAETLCASLTAHFSERGLL